MKETSVLPMPPTDKLPYKNLKDEWSSLTFDLYVVRIAQLYWKGWSSTEKVWNTFTYNNNAWGIIGDTYSWIMLPNKTIEKRWTKDLPEEIKNLNNNTTYKNYPLFLLPIDEHETDPKFKSEFDKGEFEVFPTSNLLFTVYAHESFHVYQSQWLFQDPSIDISTTEIESILQKNPAARELRLELFKNIRNAILTPSKQKHYLRLAKYWSNCYYNEYKDEADILRGVDIDEGSARYFEIAITCRTLFGFNSSKEKMENAYVKLIQSFFTTEKVRDDSVREAYDIGGLAGILLELKDYPNWQDRVAQGQRLEDILLENIEPSAP